MPEFCHLHCHTQYSLLDGATSIPAMMQKAAADGQKAVALTDHGNMFGAFQFVNEANKNGLKPIVGCEFYLVEDRHKKTFKRANNERDIRYHQLLLAKNRVGYQNLMKLCSLGYMEGFYQKYPRIDKEILVQYSEGLIATSCCLGSIVQQLLLKGKTEEAEQELKWWLDIFGEDYYIELQRHTGLENIDGLGVSQEDLNQQLIQFARKHNIDIIATNDSHYLEEEDATPHDVLLCVNTGSNLADTERFRFPSNDFYFKSQAEMGAIFSDIPEALDNTVKLQDKVELLNLSRDVLLPEFPLPEGFANQLDYLRHLTYEGAKWRWGTITQKIQERLDFELSVIEKTGYPGYFLIVNDFIQAARNMDVSVGPGRGSAAGSAVAYCLRITDVDPIHYDLLFERFLNPDRMSMPDIDIDFDDEGRGKVIDYVVDKYGKNQVAQIVTYSTMAAKSAIKDVGRVKGVPLDTVNKISKTFPKQLGASLNDVLAEGGVTEKLWGKMNDQDRQAALKIREMAESKGEVGEVLQLAKRVEGSIRGTGVHACGVIITPDDITNYVPVSTAKGNEMVLSQFDNNVAEDAGLLKMDFLGLRTLSIIKEAVGFVKERHGIELDFDEIGLEDPKTYELFQKGDTVGIFQYESGGMQKHMRELRPTVFDDLVAMNALYRPGPMQYIPNYCRRKNGKEKVEYPLPATEEVLAPTYGITVYQEQVMLLSQKLAGFTKGEADVLRKAMGKKKAKLIAELRSKFVDGCLANGHPQKAVEKIYTDWEAFAAYAFNKSHSVCYALLAYRAGYLKANYPAEYAAGVLCHNKNDQSRLTFLMRAFRNSGVEILGPSINESGLNFSVNKNGKVRFGIAALRNVGEGVSQYIIAERKKDGEFSSLFDLMRRVPEAANKRVLESLAKGGAFDDFEDVHRAQYFTKSMAFDSVIEHAVKYSQAYSSSKLTAENSLFGDAIDESIAEPTIPETEEWDSSIRIELEKEVTGIYISGHPLDKFDFEMHRFSNCVLSELDDLEPSSSRIINLTGRLTEVKHLMAKSGQPFGRFTLTDRTESKTFSVFGKQYGEVQHSLVADMVVRIKGRYEIPKWKKEAIPDFRIQKIEPLDQVAQDETSALTIRLHSNQVNSELIETYSKVIKDYPGKHEFKVLLADSKGIVQLKSSNTTVEVSTPLIEALKEIDIEYLVT